MADKAMTLRLDEELRQKAREEAFERDTSITAIIREALREHFDRKESDA